MLINIMQAVFLAVLLMFPFKSDISNYVQSYQMKNACAVADSAIVKYYIHNSVLPEELDLQVLEKMGLEADAAEDMSYEKLEERKFSLSYEDPASKEIRYSIHSNVLLPQNMDLNFGEVKEKYYPIQVEESDHQILTVKVTYPDGSIITLNEGHKFEVPANSHFEVTVVPDEGWTAGIPNVTDGSVIKDLVVNVSAAQVKNYTLTVENCVNQKVIIRVEDVHNGKTFEMNQNQSVRVGYETLFNLVKIVPNAGYNAGSVLPFSGVVKKNTFIEIVDAKPSKPTYSKNEWRNPGEYEFVVPSGVSKLRITCAGAGGGNGGDCNVSRYPDGFPAIFAGGVGGAGELISKDVNVNSGVKYIIVVGSAGTTGRSARVSYKHRNVYAGNGSNGGSSSFGDLIVARGGGGGGGASSTCAGGDCYSLYRQAHGNYGNYGLSYIGGAERGSNGWVIIEYGGDI